MPGAQITSNAVRETGVSQGEEVFSTAWQPINVQPPDKTAEALVAAYVVLGVVLAAYLASLLLRTSGVTWTWLDGWGVDVFEFVAGLLVLGRALSRRSYQRAGLTLGLGMCLWAAGDVVVTVQTLGGASAPSVGPGNFLWAGFYPLAYVGVMTLMGQEVRRLRLANYLDGVMAALSAAALFAAFAFQATERAAGGSAGSVAVNLVYPIGDILLFGLVLVGIVLLPRAGRERWYLMGAACLINTSGDVCALFPGLLATRFGAVSNGIAWPGSLFLFGLAFWFPSTTRRSHLDEIKPTFLPAALACGSALVVVIFASQRHTEPAALILAAATLVAAGIRFSLSLAYLRDLNEQRHSQLADAAQAEHEIRAALQVAMSDQSRFSGKVADGASQQSATLTETSATVNEVRIAATYAAQKAAEVADRARESLAVSDEGTHAVMTIVGAMTEIGERVNDVAQDVVALSQRTDQIGGITATVKQIAERTKLLSLNARIESARAGEHGKAFGVVAAEVGRLAQQCAEAAAQVEQVLGEIQAATAAAVTTTDESARAVENGLRLTGRAGEVIRSLSDTIRAASNDAEEIAAAAHQESVGIDQIAQSISIASIAALDLNDLSRTLASIAAA